MLTVYLIAPLALFTGLCVWIMVTIQERVDNQGRMREQGQQQADVAPPDPNAGDVDTQGDETPGNLGEGQDETGG